MYSKYKDALPEETVQRIIQIYKTLGLTMNCTVDKHISGIYSAYIQDPAGYWNTAGKGTTKEYCMASAYGESIEHICNHFAFDISRVSDKAKSYCHFIRYPDEKMIELDEIINVAPDIFKDMMEGYDLSNSIPSFDEIISIWKKLLRTDITPFVPYYCINEKKVVYLPDAIISKLCGSNGGGSGNTPYEAIGHALDEIIERYVKYEIIYNKLTPPTIPFDYISERCPDLAELIMRIEQSGRLRIIVKDASLGKNYSVICILVIDDKTQRYLANFGAHPCFEIALERCLTELFQDHKCVDNLLDRDEMIHWDDVSEKKILGLRNWVSLLRDDIGFLPDSLFKKEYSWQFKPWTFFNNYTNQFGMNYQLNILSKNGFKVYIRNNSFLSFPVYRVYVPGMSLSHLKFDNKLIETIDISESFNEYLTNGANDRIRKKILSCFMSNDSFMIDMITKKWTDDDRKLFCAVILFDSKRDTDALIQLDRNNTKLGMYIRKFLFLQSGDFVDNSANLLELFFGEECNKWYKYLKERNAFTAFADYAFANGIVMRPPNNNNSSMLQKDSLYMRIKDTFNNTAISQSSIADLL